MNRYKTHYKPNPCGRTGFQSNYTINLNDVTCISCLVKNMTEAYIKREKKMVTIDEMYSLDWKQILHKAIQSRPTSWHVENPVSEYRNASDCIAQQVISEMKKKGLLKQIRG